MAYAAVISAYSKKFGASVLDLLHSFTCKLLCTLQFSQSNRRRRIKYGDRLPLPLPSSSNNAFSFSTRNIEGLNILQELLETTFVNLHSIEENLQFWQSKVEASNARKIYFMIFQRGPLAFINEIVQFAQGSIQNRCSINKSASMHISNRIIILLNLRCFLATFLAQIYGEIERIGDELEDPSMSLISLITSVDKLFSNLQISIPNLPSDFEFEKLNKVGLKDDSDIRDGVRLIHRNVQKLDSCVSTLVVNCRKPWRTTLNWLPYTCGVIGLSFGCSFLFRHSRLAGSSDIDNWINQVKESASIFWSDHVERPLISIKEELFETFRRRHKGVMQVEEVHLTASSLHRMLLSFSEQTKGEIPEKASDQEMMEIVMARYEKELTHPIQNLLGGELARALLIQIQKLKLDIEMAMLELDQILNANEINFAVLAGLPALFVLFVVVMVVRAWFKADSRAEGRGRSARIQRRLMVVDIERGIMQYQMFVDQGKERDAEYMFGMVIYNLDRLYRAVEKHARETGEWGCLRQDIVELGKTGFGSAYKLGLTSRMERVYDCLLPSSKPK